MDNSLNALCESVKKTISQLKPQYNALSFIIITGKINQGKTTLLRQSQLQHVSIDSDRGADVYYNQEGIIVELGESWLNQSKNLLQHTLKQLNRCHQSLKISGLILCVDINEILIAEPLQFAEHSKAHTQLLHRFGQSLGYRVDTAIVFTKLDAIAGFSEFFQYEHATDLTKPLGFSLYNANQRNELIDAFNLQFERLIEMLGQNTITKMHPARSSLKRTLIREFPLQLASLRAPIQSLIQLLSLQLFRLEAVYFTSAEQGGVSLDRLNKKIQHEYALTIQDKFPQSINYRAYFIEGALSAFQNQTKRQIPKIALSHRWTVKFLAGTVGLSFLWLGYQHWLSTQLLDTASKELLLYESLAGQEINKAPALYHLTQASHSLEKIRSNTFSLSTIQDLKTQLGINAKQNIQGNFLPSILREIENNITDSRQSHAARYQALKIYLMLGEPQQFSQSEVLNWFSQHSTQQGPEQLEKKLTLLQQILRQPFQPLMINRQLVSDVRNYLNALPASFLYYTLAKARFPEAKEAIAINGFELTMNEVPEYLTKAGFQKIISLLPTLIAQLRKDNWVLARQDLNDLQTQLLQAYCFEYVAWWQHFLRRSTPLHFKNFQQAHDLMQLFNDSNAINKLVSLVQQQTSPEFGENASLFNQEIASKFTDVSLLSQSSVTDLTLNIKELEKFLTTLSLLHDEGKTAFTLAKSRFMGDTLSNPLSALYSRSQQLPEPISLWAKQLADDAWYILISHSRDYINQQWQRIVINDYQQYIAKHYPFDPSQTAEVALADFDRFFSSQGVLNSFLETYLKPFMNTSQPQWQPKELNNYVLPISADAINELIRANVITNMFFSPQSEKSKIEFSLQKISLDPIVSNLQLSIGENKLVDNQNTESYTRFIWPQANAKLTLNSIEGNQYELDENGLWAFFRMLQKVNVLVDESDSSSLQILFEVNGNSGRYVLKTQNKINPFIPGILNGFILNERIV